MISIARLRFCGTSDKSDIEIKNNYVFALAGNPNVGKSTMFNELTGMNQHTGNWAGKTVSLATGNLVFDDNSIKVVDLPGSYSLNTDTPEEKITNEYIINGDYDCVVIVADATCLERNLNFVLQVLNKTNKAVLCLNFYDEIKKKGINIDTDELSLQLGIPVVCVSARYKKGINELINTALDVAKGNIKTYRTKNISDIFLNNTDDYEKISMNISKVSNDIHKACVGNTGNVYGEFDRKADKILLSPVSGTILMILVFAVIFWLTAFGANYPGEALSKIFGIIKIELNDLLVYTGINEIIRSIIIDGIYTTVSWVVSVMLPPAMIFFPLFAILEDTGILPRFAFNLDRFFSKAGTNGKQALTMLMGFGCNACGVMGCRIIRNKKERIAAIVTNSFVPCNGRLPTLIALISVFFCVSDNKIINSITTTGILLLILVISLVVTLVVSAVLTKSINQNCDSGSFILELPPYRKPQFIKVILLSIKDKVLYVLSRAVLVSIPAGVIIWLLSNVSIDDITLLGYMTQFLNSFGETLGVDGVILTAFLLSFPANEILIPIMLMAYSSGNVMTEYASVAELGETLIENGWTWVTGLCCIVLCLFHFPCSTTCLSIKKETSSVFWTVMSVLIPMAIGVTLCFILNLIIGILT